MSCSFVWIFSGSAIGMFLLHISRFLHETGILSLKAAHNVHEADTYACSLFQFFDEALEIFDDVARPCKARRDFFG